MSILKIKDLSKKYGKIKAIDQLSMTIEAGNVYGLLGPNGSGKTTTLGIILNILKQDSGSFEWFDGAYGDFARMHIGAILETPNFYPYLNAIENLEIIRKIKKAPPTNFNDLLELVNLEHRKKSSFRTYSLGMKQRLAIAATLIGNPKVLIFDEPTNGLDPQGIAEVRNILKKIADSGNTVIMASHILDEVEKICSHVAIIKNGKLLATGPVGSILNNDITIELDADNKPQLLTTLSHLSGVKSITDQDKWVECQINENVDLSLFSASLYQAGIVPTRFVARKRRLEEEFLEITKE